MLWASAHYNTVHQSFGDNWPAERRERATNDLARSCETTFRRKHQSVLFGRSNKWDAAALDVISVSAGPVLTVFALITLIMQVWTVPVLTQILLNSVIFNITWSINQELLFPRRLSQLSVARQETISYASSLIWLKNRTGGFDVHTNQWWHSKSAAKWWWWLDQTCCIITVNNDDSMVPDDNILLVRIFKHLAVHAQWTIQS